ncbi:hypothetical protein BBJ28_00018164 [Nothophytophthora sp. Chile5]|nr:hypothetical protein BBJ28_00018164 [Nothophytophthora sp. Chile5]
MNLGHMVQVPILHKCQLLRSEMIHFTTNLHNYMMFEGLMTKESRELLKQLKLIFATIIKFCKTQENLYTTALKEVHEENMRQQTIERRTLEVSRGVSRNGSCCAFCRQIHLPINFALNGCHLFQGTWGIPENEEYEERTRRNAFGTSSKIVRQIEEIAEDFSSEFLRLLDIVKESSSRYEMTRYCVA